MAVSALAINKEWSLSESLTAEIALLSHIPHTLLSPRDICHFHHLQPSERNKEPMRRVLCHAAQYRIYVANDDALAQKIF